MPETRWKSVDNKHLTVASCWFSLSRHKYYALNVWIDKDVPYKGRKTYHQVPSLLHRAVMGQIDNDRHNRTDNVRLT